MKMTYKRMPVRLNQPGTNYSTYFNHAVFKGVVDNTNPFVVDPLSFSQAKNVYISDTGTLISRPPLALADDPLIKTKPDYELYDRQIILDTVVYVFKKGNQYEIGVAVEETILPITFQTGEVITKYHISVFKRNIIVFNDVDAMVLNVDEPYEWKRLRDLANISITKEVTENTAINHPKNQFTESYKENYIWSKNIRNILPDGDAESVITGPTGEIRNELKDANINTELRLLRELRNVKIGNNDVVTATEFANNMIICIGRHDHLLLSIDSGDTFKKVMYPKNCSNYTGIVSVSDDGLHCFVVSADLIYRYNIAENDWTPLMIKKNDSHIKIDYGDIVCWRFSGAENFAFVTYYTDLLDPDVVTAKLYVQGEGIHVDGYEAKGINVIDISDDILFMSDNRYITDWAKFAIHFIKDTYMKMVLWAPKGESNSNFIYISGKGDDTAVTANIIAYAGKRAGHITDIKLQSYYDKRSNDSHIEASLDGINIKGLVINDNNWEVLSGYIGIDVDEPDKHVMNLIHQQETANVTIPANNSAGALLKVGDCYLNGFDTWSADGKASLSLSENITDRKNTIITGDDYFYYMVVKDKLYTNHFDISTNIAIEYTYEIDEPYNKVPTVSYHDKVLYLAFGNELKITTENDKFDLPILNNHTLKTDINNIMNISNEEIALFLKNSVILVVPTPDDVFGYRYDYLPTKLSGGVRLGDDIIKTLDAKFSMYPTKEGLVALGYQQMVATMEQSVEYLSNSITNIWKEFYDASDKIHLIQDERNILLSNGTNILLLYQLHFGAWWILDLPINVNNMHIEDGVIYFIDKDLFYLDEKHHIYKDFGVRNITWYIESQPLHFKAPNNYKSISQLIFHFQESTPQEQTVQAQVKLHRKQFTLTEPELIRFKVEGYRTFVKRMNYWKVNNLQWSLATDHDTIHHARLNINDITIKYSVGDEVRA